MTARALARVLARSLAIVAPLHVLAPASVTLASEEDPGGPVVATVDDREIRQADIDSSYAAFGDAMDELPAIGEGDERLERYINFQLIAEAARDAGLAEDETVRRSIRQMTDLVLYETFLFHFENEVADEEALRERYDRKYPEDSQDAPSFEEARPELKEEAVHDALVALLAKLRENIDIETVPAGTDN